MLLALSLLAKSYLLTIHNPNTYELKDFQVRVQLPPEFKGKPITITDMSYNPVPFCYETSIGECTTDPTAGNGYVWVKVPYLPANGDAKLIIEEGRNGAVEGDNVFLLYDSLDSLSDKWDWGDLEHGVGYDSNINDYGVWFTGDANGRVAARSVNTYESPFIVEGLIYKNTGCADHFIYVSPYPDVEWSWSSESGVVKYAWDCNSMDLMTPSHDVEKSRGEETYYYVQAIITPYKSSFITWVMDNPGDVERIDIEEGLSGKLYVYFGADEDDTAYKSYWYWIRVRKYADEEPIASFAPYSPPEAKYKAVYVVPSELWKFLEPLTIVDSAYRKALNSKGLMLALLQEPLVKVMKEMSKLEGTGALVITLYKKYVDLSDNLKKLNETITNINLQEPNLLLVFNAFNLVEITKQQLDDFNATYVKLVKEINSMKVKTCKSNATKALLELIDSSKSLPMFIKAQAKVKKVFGNVDNLLLCLVEEAKAGLKENFKYLQAWVEAKMREAQESLGNSQAALDVLLSLLLHK